LRIGVHFVVVGYWYKQGWETEKDKNEAGENKTGRMLMMVLLLV
jgi:hypothetical protein